MSASQEVTSSCDASLLQRYHIAKTKMNFHIRGWWKRGSLAQHSAVER